MKMLVLSLALLSSLAALAAAVPSTDVNEMRYFLWTKDNPNNDDYQELFYLDGNSVINSNFDPSRLTKILVHGYTSNGLTSWVHEARDAYLSIGDFNVISIDYSTLGGPAPYYITCAENARPVGFRIGDFMEFIIDTVGGSLDDYHPVGWSLGGQVVGNLGHRFNGTLPRITGLDPAGPMFHTFSKDVKISELSAQVVDVIHTAGLWLGMDEICGTINFYPNSGIASQPGCEETDNMGFSCSHRRGPDYYIESITSQVGFRGVKCSSWPDYEAGLCDGNEENVMGYPVNGDATGVFFLTTNSQKPFAQG